MTYKATNNKWAFYYQQTTSPFYVITFFLAVYLM